MTTPDLPEGCCRIIDPAMSEEHAQVLARRFRALSDPTRVRILNLLASHDELCVCELQVHFELSQPTISHHLAILRKAELVEGRTRGKWTFYRARPDEVADLARTLEVKTWATT